MATGTILWFFWRMMAGLALAALHTGSRLLGSTVRKIDAELLLSSAPPAAVSVTANSVAGIVVAGGLTLTVTVRDSSVPSVIGKGAAVVRKLRLSTVVSAKVAGAPWFVMLNATAVVRPAGTDVRSEADRTSTFEAICWPGTAR